MRGNIHLVKEHVLFKGKRLVSAESAYAFNGAES
jgi:hypothetical protein